jgi:hypothetical protein
MAKLDPESDFQQHQLNLNKKFSLAKDGNSSLTQHQQENDYKPNAVRIHQCFKLPKLSSLLKLVPIFFNNKAIGAALISYQCQLQTKCSTGLWFKPPNICADINTRTEEHIYCMLHANF